MNDVIERPLHQSKCNYLSSPSSSQIERSSLDKAQNQPLSARDLSLDEQRTLFKQNRFIAMPLAGTIVWALLRPVDLCCTHFAQQYIGSHIIENASDTILA